MSTLASAPPLWLRDNCPCTGCRDPRGGRKLFQITDLPAGLTVDAVLDALTADGAPAREAVSRGLARPPPPRRPAAGRDGAQPVAVRGDHPPDGVRRFGVLGGGFGRPAARRTTASRASAYATTRARWRG
ncbi:hypothetical protein [Streptomyces sp. NPDC001594]|uniref:hypothetical protein n=1 Tax=Streptomyces sp. NPDC001594 TaxID=3364590 RepID=UPI00369C5CED